MTNMEIAKIKTMTTCRIFYQLMLAAILLQLIVGMPTDENRCLMCNDFNRENNGKPCVNSHHDCGTCLSGLIESTDDRRICIQVEILEHPKDNCEAEENADINLFCEFNHYVTCLWIHNDREVDINDQSRYQYVNGEDGIKNGKPTDCSITIKRLSKHDAGQWKCVGWINSDIDPCSTLVNLNGFYFFALVSRANVVEETIASSVIPPNYVTGFAIAFLNSDLILLLVVFGHMQTNNINCLTCNDFNRNNNKKWCIDHYTDCGDCKPGFVLSDDDPRICFQIEIIEKPLSVVGASGSNISLRCVYNSPVSCLWTRDNREVKISGQSRYNYAKKLPNKNAQTHDCSLKIKNLSKIDVGQWQCGGWINSDLDPLMSESADISLTIQGN
ncbi:hypothetical protein CHUAL_006799 [Chamberlinius hualienensis]